MPTIDARGPFLPGLWPLLRARFQEFDRSHSKLLIGLCALSFVIYASAVLVQAQYRLSFWVSDNHTQLPGAVSYAAHGAQLGTVDSQVQSRLVESLQQHQPIAAAVLRASQPDAAGGQTEIAKDGVGVGYLVFTSLSMKVFGARIDAIPLGLLVLLALSAVLFVARFRGARLLVPPFLFLVLTFILITPVTTDPVTLSRLPIGGSRYTGVIAILPAIHIIYELLERPAATRGETWRHLLLFGVQAALLAFAVIVRGGTGYLLLAIGVLSLIMLWRARMQRAWRLKLFGAWASLVTASVLVLTIMVVSVPSEYVSSGRFFGNFWHRVFIGLSERPAWPYGKLTEMFPCTNIFPEGLRARYDPAGHCAWSSSKPDYHPTPEQWNWDQNHNLYDSSYERVLRDAFFNVVKTHPREVFETFVYHKSRRIRATLLEALGVHGPYEPAAGPDDYHASLLTRAAPFVVLQFLVLGACLLVAGMRGVWEMMRLAGLFAAFFLLSLIPLYAVYSYLYVSLDTVIYMYALLAVTVTLVVQAGAAAVGYYGNGSNRHFSAARSE